MENHRELFLMQQIYGTLFSLANKVQIQGDKYFKSLTSRQFMTLLAIAHLSEDETTINNIAKKLGTTKQSVKQLIKIIEEKGYIVTVPSQKDRRAVNIKITESGKQVSLDCAGKALEFFADIFKDFTIEEMDILWSLLKKLYRFDGEEQDGFEENAGIELAEADQFKALKEFERQRNKSRNVREKNE